MKNSNGGLGTCKRHAMGIAALVGAALFALPAQAQEGELVVAAPQEVQSLQAQLTYKEVNAVGLRNVIEQLVGLDTDNGEFFPMLATSWEQVEPTRWRFTLREGVNFHDGSPFNAEAAGVSITWAWDEENKHQIRESAGPAISYEVVDEFTLDLVTADPDPLLLKRMYLTGIGSAKQIQETPTEYDFQPIGTGPYKFVEWVAGQYWSMEAYPGWWGNTAGDSYGEMEFEKVKIVFRPEPEVRAAMVESGEADIAMAISNDQCERLRAAESTDCLIKASDVYLFSKLDVTGAHPALEDVRMRTAIDLAIDIESIAEFILAGIAEPMDGQMIVEGGAGYDPDVEDYGFDPDKARGLVEEMRSEGIEIPTIHIASRIGNFPRNGEVIEAMGFMLSEVGIENTVGLEEPAFYNEWVTTRPTRDRSNMAVHILNDPLSDYALGYSALYSCWHAFSSFCNEELDEMHRQASQLTGEERNEALQELVRRIHEEHAVLPIANLAGAFGVAADLEWTFGRDQRIVAVNISRSE